MRLLLMRHGDASWQAASDSQRPLSDKGQLQVLQQASVAGIDWQGYQQLWASPYLRTQQTTQILSQNWRNEQAVDIQSSTLITPNGDCESVQEFLLQQTQADTILVTHQPLVSCLIGYFCEADIFAGEAMMPASVAVLSGDVFAKGCMQLESLVHAN